MASSMLLVAAMTCSTGDFVEVILLTSTVLEAAALSVGVCVRKGGEEGEGTGRGRGKEREGEGEGEREREGGRGKERCECVPLLATQN